MQNVTTILHRTNKMKTKKKMHWIRRNSLTWINEDETKKNPNRLQQTVLIR